MPGADVLNIFAVSCQEIALASLFTLDGDAVSYGRAMRFMQKTADAIVDQLTPLFNLSPRTK